MHFHVCPQTHDDRTSDLHWVKVKVSDSSTFQVTNEEAGKTKSGFRFRSCPGAGIGSCNSATADAVLSEVDVLPLALLPAPSTPPRTPRERSSPPPAPRMISNRRVGIMDCGTLNTRMGKLVECNEDTSPDLSGSAPVTLHSRDMQPQLVKRAIVEDVPRWTASADRRDSAAKRIAEMQFGVPEFPAAFSRHK